MLIYLSLDIICSLKLTVFLQLLSPNIFCILEHIMFMDKYPCIFFASKRGYWLYTDNETHLRQGIQPICISIHKCTQWWFKHFVLLLLFHHVFTTLGRDLRPIPVHWLQHSFINSSCEFNGHYKFEWLILSPFLQILALSFKQHLIVDIFNSYHLSA